MSAELPDPPHGDLPPIDRAALCGLFDALSQPDPPPCTHTFQEAREYLTTHGLPVESTLAWLKRNGAGCDCEVIYNTDAEWGEWAGRTPAEE